MIEWVELVPPLREVGVECVGWMDRLSNFS